MSSTDENADDKAAITAKDNKDIAKGAGANFFGFILRLGSRLPFLILAVTLFGPELYGRYNYTITTVELCAAFATFGFKRSLLNLFMMMNIQANIPLNRSCYQPSLSVR